VQVQLPWRHQLGPVQVREQARVLEQQPARALPGPVSVLPYRKRPARARPLQRLRGYASFWSSP